MYSLFLYWTFGMIYVFLDVFNWPKSFRKYKVQPGTNEPVDKRKLALVSNIQISCNNRTKIT